MNTSKKRYALISVTDKTGVVEFASALCELGFTILSTGGTSKLLRESKIPTTDVAEFTKSPEVLDGRVKTLHPLIHGGILADLSNPTHVNDLQKINGTEIDVVAVNLYNFAENAKSQRLSLDKSIEYVDVGGPTMLRAAAKNHARCYAVIDPSDYSDVLTQLKSKNSDLKFRQLLAAKVFRSTALYDQMIADYFEQNLHQNTAPQSSELKWSNHLTHELKLIKPLRYGENSHQSAALYQYSNTSIDSTSIANAEILQGKELSYNNYVDLDAAAAIVADLAPLPAITIIKHTNPCGTAASLSLPISEIFKIALSSDPKCAFGGVVASNAIIDETTAMAMNELFLECIVAPNYSKTALEIFAHKKNLRILKSNAVTASARPKSSEIQWKSIHGAVLGQTPDTYIQDSEQWKCVTHKKPNAKMLADLSFAMTICKHVKSNAIVVASDLKTLGVGAGQMSRIDSAKFAIDKARALGHVVKSSVLASDAFFPFRDTVDEAARAGISAIVQPGGSLRDQESMDAANEHGIVMMITGTRHFKH